MTNQSLSWAQNITTQEQTLRDQILTNKMVRGQTQRDQILEKQTLRGETLRDLQALPFYFTGLHE